MSSKKSYFKTATVLMFTLVAACGGSSTTTPTSTTDTALQGLASCEAQATGAICGTLLAPDGVTPIANAEITQVDSSSSLIKLTGKRHLTADTSACLSDATGAFACVCAATGSDITFSVDSALFDFEFTATCTADATTEVAATETTAESSEANTVAVVTGSYDQVEAVIADMFDCGDVTSGALDYGTECNRLHIFDGGARVFSGDLDPNNGDTEYRTIDDLLTAPTLMDDYDMIFLNCGLDETLADDATVMANLAAYVEAGGKIYASDWAYNFVEQAFPTLIDFYGDTVADGLGSTPETMSEAKDGSSNSAQSVNVDDAGILTYLRENDIIADDATTASIDFDLGGWVVMVDADDAVTQLLTADSLPNGPSGVTNLPIAVLNCDDTANGGLFYGSYHTEIGAATDADDAQEAILRYMILNGFNACEI